MKTRRRDYSWDEITMNKKMRYNPSDADPVSCRLLKKDIRETDYVPILTGSFSSLPGEIFMEILSQLPIETLCRLRFVCKVWYFIIRHPIFAKVHLSYNKQITKSVIFRDQTPYSAVIVDHQVFDMTKPLAKLPIARFPIRVQWTMNKNEFRVDSCNGLIFNQRPFYVTNPITGEYRGIPNPVMHNRDVIASGFGFDSVNMEYKVFRVLKQENVVRYGIMLQIHTVGSRAWRWVTTNNLCSIKDTGSCAFVNGVFHWMGVQEKKSNVPDVIVSFNVHTEEFGRIPLPRGLFLTDKSVQYLMVLGESLCLVEEHTREHIRIWVMKEYGVKSSWVSRYGMSDLPMGDKYPKGPYVPLQLMKNGEILMLLENRYLGFYDPERDDFKCIEDDGTGHGGGLFKPVVYVGSLISPRSIGRITK